MRKAFLGLLFIIFTLAWGTARADTINFRLTSPLQTGAAGQALSFEATISAALTNIQSIYLDSLSVNALDGLLADTDDFYNNFPLFLAPGETFTGQLFLITLDGGLPPSFSLSGLATVQGRVGSSEQMDLASAAFSVNATATPEPSTLWLLLTGVAGYAATVGRRRFLIALDA